MFHVEQFSQLAAVSRQPVAEPQLDPGAATARGGPAWAPAAGCADSRPLQGARAREPLDSAGKAPLRPEDR